ncbi:MAG: nucleoside triphosphate pyrophosphohydrolase [Planctomycetes bacterium]|nr:nucleoside triphosphate pyrophosphohydrolase [Planctomycetota bacterium]
MKAAGDEFEKLRCVVAALRAPDGCPWDRKQTLADVGRYIVDEACEVSDAIAEGGGEPEDSVSEELGDLLMTVLLACGIAEEKGAFSIDDVARGVREKLVRRHPHVFGEERATAAEEVIGLWERVKAEERAKDPGAVARSRLGGVPRSLPPLAAAFKVSARAARCGFDWPDAAGPLAKLEEEIGEVRELLDAKARPLDSTRPERLLEELGDLIFSAVNVCRKLGLHPDDALRTSVRKFIDRFHELELRLPNLEEASLEEMDRIWDEKRSGASLPPPAEPR